MCRSPQKTEAGDAATAKSSAMILLMAMQESTNQRRLLHRGRNIRPVDVAFARVISFARASTPRSHGVVDVRSSRARTDRAAMFPECLFYDSVSAEGGGNDAVVTGDTVG